MKLHLIFVGNKFSYNQPLKEYVVRAVEKEFFSIDTLTYFKESDNSFFLFLEEKIGYREKILLVSSRQNFSTIGKVLCTVTGDNQILKEGMLIPQKAMLFEERSYLLEYQGSQINVLQMDENSKFPQILLRTLDTKATVHIFDETSDDIVAVLNPIAQTYEVNFGVTTYVDGWLRVDISAKRYGEISQFIHAVKNLLPKKLIASKNIVEHIIQRVSAKKRKITFAESCTGGLLAYCFTKNNGASKILDGSLVTYSNLLKENWLGVDHEILQNYGAVSAEVVSEMSEGALSVSGADYAISISGIAGDGGGSKAKPVGSVHIGVRSKTEHKERCFHFNGDRNYIQYQSVMMAIKMLLLLDRDTFF